MPVYIGDENNEVNCFLNEDIYKDIRFMIHRVRDGGVTPQRARELLRRQIFTLNQKPVQSVREEYKPTARHAKWKPQIF